jgi:hypothetical protein
VVRWGGHTPFVPGHGLVVSSLVTTAPVIGADMRAADGITGAAVFAQGQNVVIQVETEQHGDSVELDQTLVSVAPRALVPDAPQRQGFGLALSSYGFSDAVRRVGWLEGRHFPEASVVVPGAPTGTHVRLERRSGPVLLDAYVDARGVATLPLLGDLAVGDAFVVRAEAYGYLPSATREVVAGERVRLIIPKGGQVWVRLGDLSGTPMPARIRILGREGTATPALGPDYFASGAGEAVVTATGEAVIPCRRAPTASSSAMAPSGPWRSPMWSSPRAPAPRSTHASSTWCRRTGGSRATSTCTSRPATTARCPSRTAWPRWLRRASGSRCPPTTTTSPTMRPPSLRTAFRTSAPSSA